MLQGSFYKTAHGQLSYEIFEAEPDYLKTILAFLQKSLVFVVEPCWELE